MAKAYRTVSNVALCIINGITPINIKIEERGKLYEITKGGGTNYDKEMEKENCNHPAFHVKIIETNADNPHNKPSIQRRKQERSRIWSSYCYIPRQ